MYLSFYRTCTFTNSILAFNQGGSAVYCHLFSEATAICTDIYGNPGGDWVGCLSGQQGSGGNFYADPLFCDLETDDLRLGGQSPCLPGQHPDGAACGLVGALGVGCGVTGAEATTWGNVKVMISPPE